MILGLESGGELGCRASNIGSLRSSIPKVLEISQLSAGNQNSNLMRLGLAISMVLHAALLAWALVSIAEPREFKIPEPEPILADVITESQLIQLRKGSRDAKLDDAMAKDVPKPDEAVKETPKPKPVVATPPPPPPPPPEPEVKPPEPVAEPPPPAPKEAPDQLAMLEKLDDVAQQQALEKQRTEAAARAKAEDDRRKAEELKKKADEKKKAADKKAADKKKADEKKRQDLAKAEKAKAESARISALIDKAPDPKQAPASAPTPAAPTTAKGPVKGDPTGRDAANAGKQGLLGKIVDKVKTCWNIQAGGSEASSQVPVIRFELNRDGSIRGAPRVMNDQTSPQFRLAADAAMRALIECQKYELPADKYDQWKLVTLEFDPREMFQ